MKLKYLLIVGFVLLNFYGSLSQDLSDNVPIRNCATMEQDSISRARFPQRRTLDEFERAIQTKISEIQRRSASGRTLAGVVTIPIIVHIIHNGEAVGTGTNISQAQVQAQIAVLNEDFRKKLGTRGYNTNPVGADIEIEFCLSPVDKDGKTMAEPGIHRYDGNKDGWTTEEIASLKSITYWDPNKFYNIWTLKFAAANANLLGFAQFPDQSGLSGLDDDGGPASTDGVVIRYQSFGSTDKGSFPVMQAPYDKGRTLTHETGHWLGLRHIWGDGTCADDFVGDTPTAHTSNSGCPSNKLSCDNVNFEMVQNYMDYTNDACMNIFTQGQKVRMQAVMEISPRRKTLILANLCSPILADIPTANFTSNKTLVLRGGKVNFTDLSSNFPTSWAWEFDGGDPSTSTSPNPRITYSVPGKYKVKLVAKNSIGPSDPYEVVDYMTVSEENICSTQSNFLAGYTPSALPLSDFGNYTGYLTGNNSIKTSAVSEYFKNSLGYLYISGAQIQFSNVYAPSEDATVTVTVWNARGTANAPGSVIEQKVVLLKQIKEDIANNRPTTIVFDRESPVFSLPYQIGVEFNYTSEDTVVVQSSDNGEALQSSSWIRNEDGVWSPYPIAFGANIALNITPVIGINPSVQVSASKQLVNPGEEVILNGQGASVFVWNADDGSVEDYAGPQLIVRPTQTTTYLTIGSGLDLCYDSAYTTIYTRDDVLSTEEDAVTGISIYPNPGASELTVDIENSIVGDVQLQLQSVMGSEINMISKRKETRLIRIPLETHSLNAGVYLVKISIGGRSVVKKWIKL